MGIFFKSKGSEHETIKKIQAEYLRNTKKYLGEVSAEAEALIREANRKQRDIVEYDNEIARLQRYAEKAVLAENDADAREYLAKKFAVEELRNAMQVTYEHALAEAEKKCKERDELVKEISELESLE